jgi:hypothetical protein
VCPWPRQSYNIFTQRVVGTLKLKKFDEILDIEGLNSFLKVKDTQPCSKPRDAG